VHIVPEIQRSCLAFALRSTPNDSNDSGINSNDGDDSSDSGRDQNQNPALVPAPAPSLSLLERMDEVGQKLKPMAIDAKDASVAAADVDKSKAFLYTIKSCVLFGLFIAYRAYRGLFVLLPAVFRETYSKLESSSILAPFVDEDELDGASRDINPETGKVRFRTRATVAVLSMMITLSYVVSGAWRVLSMLFKTLLAKGSMKNSLEAAADEVLVNEDKIKKITKQDDDDEKNGRVNGSGGKLDGSGM